MTDPRPVPLFYTFGNHMHWVDMEWLWGYHVLPGSVRDMLRFCREAGVKGNVNFDGVGYEKLAAEDPEAFAELRAAVQEGMIEPVGCSYGQPYGLFHGGESNIRQRVYGVRAVHRLLGLRPRTFWEEEFDFFPQLPQLLRGVGFEYASLFFQWTWHTPEVPKEDVPVVWWEAPDGSRLLSATRNKLNLHQWPEDMELTLSELRANPPPAEHGMPLVLQWLELMPSPDWMCRSEVLLPKMRELMNDPRFEVQVGTLSEYLGGTSVPDVVSSGVPPEVQRRHGAYLPHWTQSGAIYAVTFRLDDSLPRAVQEAYAEERRRLKQMHERGALDSKALFFEYQRLYSAKVEGQLDAGLGSCLLRESGNAEIVANALRHFDGQRYRLHAWCIMPNHVHVVVEPQGPHTLPEILHTWKSYTSHELNKRLSRQGPVWQEEYYDHLIRGVNDLQRQCSYVEDNPTKAGLLDWDWVWRLRDPGDGDEDAEERHGEAASKRRTHDHGRDGHENLGRDAGATPVRQYRMDEVWHGLSLGKNADRMRLRSAETEGTILAAESLAATMSLFGRPYPQWDVYPTWELEEAWRELLQAQHHDNDECEGLCGRVGVASYERAQTLAQNVLELQEEALSQRAAASAQEQVFLVQNPLPWPRKSRLYNLLGQRYTGREVEVPALGWTIGPGFRDVRPTGGSALGMEIERDGPFVTQIRTDDWPEGILAKPLGRLSVGVEGTRHAAEPDHSDEEGRLVFPSWQEFASGTLIAQGFEDGRLRLSGSASGFEPIDPGFGGAWRLPIDPSFEIDRVFADTPFAVEEITSGSRGVRKYPEGDWMTSPQWFEEVQGAFTCLSFVDLVASDGRGLLLCTKSTRQWFLNEAGVELIAGLNDPWDERAAQHDAEFDICLVPHGPISHADRYRIAQEFRHPLRLHVALGEPGDLPPTFSPVQVESDNVVISAFFREMRDSAKGQSHHAADELGMDYPFVLRLVELNGQRARARLTFGATLGGAIRTNLLGEPEEVLVAPGKEGREIALAMRPHEIATIYL
ncbi:MAG TPA: transposase, partial [Fimbriimonadaceae bacterium]|nr:transposase [Fimbriimonadaceae bacterium]